MSFDDLLVVEVGDSRAGAYCAKMFADLGAEVHTLGPWPHDPAGHNPAGHDTGGLSTGDPGTSDPGDGAPGNRFYATSVHDDPELDDNGRAALLRNADIVIHASAHQRLTATFDPASDRQIVVRISPFASTGPYADWRSTDLVDTAIAGHLRLNGDPERAPIQSVPDLVHHAAGVMAFVGTMGALITRLRSGAGQTVETSHHEVIVALHQFTLLRHTHNGDVLNRLGNRYAGAGSPIGGYECADGWVGLALPQSDQMERMLEVTGLISLLERDDVDSIWDLMVDPTIIDAELVPYLRTQSRDELVELFQALRLPCAPTLTMADLLADEHFEARGFWQQISAEASGPAVALPGPPFRLSGHDWSIGPRSRRPEHVESEAERPEPATDLIDGPLTGLRVLDMTRVWAGPLAARILADLGAEVVMTEVPWTRTPREVPQSYVDGTHFFPDNLAGERPWNRTGFHNKYAINKLSTVIELDKPDGRELFADLVRSADVLVENYSPRVMPGFGFDDTRLHELNPDLVYVTMPGYGRDGPFTDWVAYGPTIDGHVGHTTLTGYLGAGPWKSGIAWPDPIGGMHGAAAALVAIHDRLDDPTAPGQTAEVAQVEAAVNMIGHHVVAAQEHGEPTRWGNRRPGRAPQGVYPCAGDDRWIAISVTDDAMWRALCEHLGWADLAHMALTERWDRHDELDERLTAFARDRNDLDLMVALQAAGVAAGAVADASDVLSDPQLGAIDVFVELEHADAGTHPWARFPVRLSRTPATMRRPAPLMGEHNEYVACDLGGLSAERYQDLLDQGIIRTEPPD